MSDLGVRVRFSPNSNFNPNFSLSAKLSSDPDPTLILALALSLAETRTQAQQEIVERLLVNPGRCLHQQAFHCFLLYSHLSLRCLQICHTLGQLLTKGGGLPNHGLIQRVSHHSCRDPEEGSGLGEGIYVGIQIETEKQMRTGMGMGVGVRIRIQIRTLVIGVLPSPNRLITTVCHPCS